MRTLTLLLILNCFLTTFLTAQTKPRTNEAMEGVEQQAYGSPQMLYVSGGFLHLGTDISGPALTGWSTGMGYQTYLSDLDNPLFLRLGILYGQDKDIDDELVSDERFGLNQTLQDLGYSAFVRNYSTTVMGLQANLGYDIVSLFAKGGAQRFGLYPIVGGDVYYYSTNYDALDANGQIYDFSTIDFEADAPKDQVEELLDGEYETEASETNKLGIGLNVGLGFRYHFSEIFGLGLEHQAGWTLADTIDGYASDDDNDSINHTRLFAYFMIGG